MSALTQKIPKFANPQIPWYKMNVISKTAMACICAACVASAAAQKGDWAAFSRFAADNKRVAALPEAERRIVFLGNSIIQLWSELHPEFFTDNKYIPRGISGQTSYQYLLRLREDVVNLRPKYVVLCGPVNDIAENTYPYNEDMTMGNIESICELLKAHKIKVVLGSCLPSTAIPWDSKVKNVSQKILSLNARLKAYARKRRLHYADYYPLMQEGESGAMRREYTSDGVHPTLQGYSVMEAYIKDFIDKKLR